MSEKTRRCDFKSVSDDDEIDYRDCFRARSIFDLALITISFGALASFDVH